MVASISFATNAKGEVGVSDPCASTAHGAPGEREGRDRYGGLKVQPGLFLCGLQVEPGLFSLRAPSRARTRHRSSGAPVVLEKEVG